VVVAAVVVVGVVKWTMHRTVVVEVANKAKRARAVIPTGVLQRTVRPVVEGTVAAVRVVLGVI
jgi:hypothetical protein